MPSLHELQSGFAAAIFRDGDDAGRVLAWCAGDRPERGLQAYRNNVLGNLARAVRLTYPVVERIVGTPFLDAVIDRYVRERPSASGDLNAYGSDFGDFLAGQEAAVRLPYLPDVAKLEWQVQQVYGAPDAVAQDLSTLAAVAPQDWGELRFLLNPAHAVLASRWPLARIWEVNQPGYGGDFRVDFDAAEAVLIHRGPEGTAVERLLAGEHDFVRALAAGDSLARAAERALRHDSFDLQTALQRFISNGLIRRACA